MRLAFISDLHGNVPALDEVFGAIEELVVDEIICLGDIVDLGPEPARVVEMLRERDIPCVGGNHDPLDEHPEYPMLRDIEAWTADRLDAETRAWLEGLPFSIEREAHGYRLLGVHGSPRADTEIMAPSLSSEEFRAMLAGCAHDVVVAGHSHEPMVRRLATQLLVNIGSVGLAFREVYRGGPRGPVVLPFAEFGTVDLSERGISATIHRVGYDIDAYVKAVRDADMPHQSEWLGHRRR